MSKVYNSKLNKSIISLALVVVFTVTIILIPFNTVYAAEDNGVVVTDTEISFDDKSFSRFISSNLPILDQFGFYRYYDSCVGSSSRYFNDLLESDSSHFIYFYIPSLNCVFYCYIQIFSFSLTGITCESSSGITFYVFDFNDNTAYSIYTTNNLLNLNNCSFYKNTVLYNGSSYVGSSYTSLGYLFSDIDFLHDINILYSNYRINGFYEPDDSVYDLPDSILSYQYLFYRPDHGYVFIDSGEKLSDLNTSLSNVNNSGSFTSSFWIHWSDDFNKLVYKSLDGSSWDLLNGSSVYGSSYNTSDSLVRDVLGIPSGNSVSVWSYFQNTPNIPVDLVMTEFFSGDPIGQTIEFDSGSGDYVALDSLSSYVADFGRTSYDYIFLSGLDNMNMFHLDKLLGILNASLTSDHIYFYEVRYYDFNTDDPSIHNNDPSSVIDGNRFTCLSLKSREVGDDFYYNVVSFGTQEDIVEPYYPMAPGTILTNYHTLGSFPYYVFNTKRFTVLSVNSVDTIHFILSSLNNNIIKFDTNMQTGFTNLTDQVHSLFDSSELGNNHLFNILNKLDDIIAKPDLDLNGVVEKLDQIISSLGSGSSDLLPADDSNSPLNPLYDKLSTLVNGLGFNNAEGVGILALLTSIAENVGDIADSLDDDQSGQVGSAIASFGSSSASLAALLGTFGAGIASFSGGFTLFSGSASAFYNSLPSGVKLLVIVAPTFMLCSGVMYGARKIYGG